MKGNTFSMSKQFSVTNLTRTGILISMSLVLNLIFLFYIPVVGFNAVKVTFSTAITMLTGIVCGPVMGFFSGAIVDILTCIIKPAGPYFPGFTLAAGLSGLIPALIYKYLKKDSMNYNLLNTVFIAVLSSGCVGAFIIKDLLSFENSTLYYNGKPLNVLFVIGFLVLAAAYIIVPIIITSRFNFSVKVDKILFTVSVSQFITSILLNTYFLSVVFGKGYLAFLPARIISNFFLIPIYTIVIAAILSAVEKRFKLDI